VITKKNIFFLSQTAVFDLGKSAGKEVVYRTIQALSQNFTVHLFAPGHDPEIQGCIYYPLPSRWFQRFKGIPIIGFLYNFIYVLQLKNCIKNHIQKHTPSPDALYMAGPWMSHIGYMLFNTYPIFKVCRYYGVNWKPKKHNTFKEKIRFYLKNKGYKRFHDLIIMTNDGTQGDEFLKRIGCPNEKIRFWRNGLTIPESLPDKAQSQKSFKEKNNIPSKNHILLAVSRLAAWKRVDRIILGLAHLIKINPAVSLVIAGDGEQKNTLQHLTKELNLQEHVVFAGPVMHHDLQEYYTSADIFISMYDYSNAGNPLFEAMAHACSIVTLDSTGMEEILPGDAGILLPDFQDEVLAQKLNFLLENDDYRLRMGQNAREHAMKHFLTWDKRIELELIEIQAGMETKKRLAR